MKPATAAQLLRRDSGFAGGYVQHVNCERAGAADLFGIVKDGRTVGAIARCSCGAQMRVGAQPGGRLITADQV